MNTKGTGLKQLFSLLLAAMVLFIAAPAIAYDSGDYYVGAQFGSTSGIMSGDSPTGYGVILGQVITSNLSAEYSYNLLGSSDCSKTNAWVINGVYFYPIKESVELLVKLGVTDFVRGTNTCGGYGNGTGSYWGGSGAQNSLGLSLGLGGQYNISKAVGIRIGFDRYPGTGTMGTIGGNLSNRLNTMYFMSAGGVFNF